MVTAGGRTVHHSVRRISTFPNRRSGRLCSSSPVWIFPSRHSFAAAVPRTPGCSLDVASCHFFPFPSTGYVELAGRGPGACLISCSQTSLVHLHYLGCRRITKGWKNQFEEALEGFRPVGGVGWNFRRIGREGVVCTGPSPPNSHPPPPQVPASTPSSQPRYQIPQRQGSLEPAVPPCKGVGSQPRMSPGDFVPLACPGRTWLNPVDGWKGRYGTNIFMCIHVCVCVRVCVYIRVCVCPCMASVTSPRHVSLQHGCCPVPSPAMTMFLMQLPKHGVWPGPASRGYWTPASRMQRLRVGGDGEVQGANWGRLVLPQTAPQTPPTP